MNHALLRAVIKELDEQVFDLDLALTEADDPAKIAEKLQRALDYAQQRLDDARVR
jgi:exonuclease VII small subunit